jgi:DNA-binding NarL/FixJ family response regulator
MFRTLIVEDDHTFRQTLLDLLRGRFPAMALEEMQDGTGILEKISRFSPDLIFMDIKLPGENGLQLTKKIKSIYPDMTIIILTSYHYPEYEQAALQNGADHFISKHAASVNDIINLVDNIID